MSKRKTALGFVVIVSALMLISPLIWAISRRRSDIPANNFATSSSHPRVSSKSDALDYHHFLSHDAQATQSAASADQFRKDLATIRLLREQRNLLGLADFTEQVEMTWSGIDADRYGLLMLEIVGALDSVDFQDAKQYVLARKYAKQALNKADLMTLPTEIEIAAHLQGDSEYLSNQLNANDWSQDRRERANYLLHAWRRLNSEINRNFDFENSRPKANLLPPPGHGPAGIAPEAIKDAQARAKYEADIAENNRRAAEFNKQWKLHNLDKYFTDSAKRFLTEAYSKPPYNNGELRQLLNSYNVDANTKHEILTQVAKKESQSIN